VASCRLLAASSHIAVPPPCWLSPQGEHIPMPEFGGHASGEGLQGFHSRRCDELDRGTIHLADRKGGTSTAVASRLVKHRAGEPLGRGRRRVFGRSWLSSNPHQQAPIGLGRADSSTIPPSSRRSICRRPAVSTAHAKAPALPWPHSRISSGFAPFELESSRRYLLPRVRS